MGLSALVDKEIKMNRNPVMKKIDIEDIVTNPLNKYKITDIEELAENIKEYGLLKPLEVYQIDDKFKIIGGERRYNALSLLYERDMIDAEIQCLVYPSPSRTADERMQIIISNAQRDMDEKQKVEITKELLEILKEDPTKKPGGMPTVNWLSGFLGCSPRTAQKYKNLAEGKTHKKEKKDQSERKSKKSSLDDLRRLMSDTNKEINKIYWNMTEEERHTVIGVAGNEEVNIVKLISKIMGVNDRCVRAIDSLNK